MLKRRLLKLLWSLPQALGYLLLLGVVASVVYGLWQISADSEAISRVKEATGPLSALAIAGGLFLAWRRVEIQQRGQITERFSKAVEQLAEEKPAVRLGGIYALEKIAEDNPKYYVPVVEVLCASLRDRHLDSRPVEDGQEPSEAGDGEAAEGKGDSEATETDVVVPTDVQTICDVLNRLSRKNRDSEYRFALFGADLRKVQLKGVRLVGANLSGAALIGANLEGAKLMGANLAGAKLSGATLVGGKLNVASLRYANLEGAQLLGATLIGATLFGADLEGANFDDATLSGANLEGAKLNGASFIGADLEGAQLMGATLIGAYLFDAKLAGADLDSDALDGAYRPGNWVTSIRTLDDPHEGS